MKLKITILVMLAGIPLITIAQDQSLIGVEPSKNSETEAALSGLPTDEIQEMFDRMKTEEFDGAFQNRPNNISADELDTRALKKIFRSLDFPDRPPMLEKLNEDAKSTVHEILLDAHQFSLIEESASLEALCSQWNSSGSTEAPALRSELSLEAYKSRQDTSQPSVNNRYQQALAVLEKGLSPEESKYFLEVFGNTRDSYLDTMIVDWGDFVRNSPNSSAMIEGTCTK